MKLTPVRSIRKYCIWCYNGEQSKAQVLQIKDCPTEKCPLYPFRMGKRARGNSPLKSIRKRCIDCSAGIKPKVRYCEFTDCPLYQYRFGKRHKTSYSPKELSQVELVVVE